MDAFLWMDVKYKSLCVAMGSADCGAAGAAVIQKGPGGTGRRAAYQPGQREWRAEGCALSLSPPSFSLSLTHIHTFSLSLFRARSLLSYPLVTLSQSLSLSIAHDLVLSL